MPEGVVGVIDPFVEAISPLCQVVVNYKYGDARTMPIDVEAVIHYSLFCLQGGWLSIRPAH